MNINDPEHPVYRLAELNKQSTTLSELSLTFFTVRKQKETDQYYRVRESALSMDVQLWLKRQMITALRSFRRENSNGKPEFQVSDYNFELQKNDSLSRLHLTTQDGSLYERKQGLIAALLHSDTELADHTTHFQLIRTQWEEQEVYFCYYRKPKRSIGKKKFAFKNSGELQFTDSDLIEIGGPIDFFIYDDEVYIASLRPFEYAFDYKEHITELRDRNLKSITELPLFDSEQSNPDAFEASCRHVFYSRSLAQIQPDTLRELQSNFERRCEDLRIIHSRLPQEPGEAEAYRQHYRVLWDLYDYIDLDAEKVVFHEGDNPKTLIQFFSDKIVQSFLTGDYEVAVGFESSGQSDTP